MDSHSLLQSLLADASNLPHRDAAKLDALRKRAKMIITKVFSPESHYLKDLDAINFYPVAAWEGMGSEWHERCWKSGSEQLLNLLNTAIEDLQLTGSDSPERTSQRADLKKGGAEKEKHQIVNIHKFTGVLGNVTNSQVTLYDYSSIHQLLAEHGIAKTDRRELEDIMEEIKTAQPDKKPSLVARAEKWFVKHKETLGAGAEMVAKVIGAMGN